MSGAGAARDLPLGPLPSTRAAAPVSALFAATLFLSAAALFMVQPMLGKMLLPLVGGTPAGWIAAMAFFQLMLLAGYALAFLLAKLPPRGHGLAFAALLCAGALFLPLRLPAAAPGEPGPLLVFRLLFSAVGLPFIALSAASSTLQRLFAATREKGARDPYFLYAASNLGSFTGLFAYPLALEALFTLPEQAQLWTRAYGALIVAALACTGFTGTAPAPEQTSAAAPLPRLAWRRRLEWIFLAFVPSSLMLGVTSHITTDLVAAPLIWVVPLGLYLLTFVAGFSRRPVPAGLVQRLHPSAVAVAMMFILILTGHTPFTFFAMAWHLFAFAVTALLCHGRLAALRPLEDQRRLPDYYLMIALGGALGGALNAFVAPLVFDRMAEYPLLLLLSCLANPMIRAPLSFRHGTLYLLGGLLLVFAAGLAWRDVLGEGLLRGALLFSICVLVSLHPRLALATGAALYVVSQFLGQGDMVLQARNFYGVIRVYDENWLDEAPGSKPVRVRLFRHGTTAHSAQILTPGRETQPITYYAPQGPVGDIFRSLAPRNVAVMGLGAGTIACYMAPGRSFTFLEIDPAVAEMARRQFSFLDRCGRENPPRVILGDGRLEFAKLQGSFDLIVLDAFSSDMVPTHLLTREALRLYLGRLAPHGWLVFNVSNRYLRLQDTLAAVADDAGLANVTKVDATMKAPFHYASAWFVMARDKADLAPLQQPGSGWITWDAPPGARPWTDDYSSVLGALKFAP